MRQEGREGCWYADRFAQIGAGASYEPEEVDELYKHETRQCDVCRSTVRDSVEPFLSGRGRILVDKLTAQSKAFTRHRIARRLQAYRRRQWVIRIKRAWSRMLVALNI